MGRKCLTCSHKKYRQINRQLVEGRTPVAEISRRYGISADALHAHRKRCLHTNLINAQRRRELDYSNELWDVFKKSLTRLNANVTDLEDVIAQTKKRKHYSTLLKALGEVRATLQLSYQLMHSITTTSQTTEADILTAFQDERIGEILYDLQTDELRAFYKVISKIMDKTNVPLIETQSLGGMGGKGEGALTVEEDDLEDENGYQSLMVRTRFPGDRGGVINQNKATGEHVHDPVIAQDDGADDVEPDETPPPSKWKPPISQIHFESGQAFVGHLYRRKRKRK